MKFLLCASLFFVTFSHTFSQQKGSFSFSVVHNDTERNVHCYVPTNYDAEKSCKLVVGLHGCAGATEAGSWRNALRFLSDSIQAIVVCPEGLSSGYMGQDIDFVQLAIDTAKKMYTIDTTNIFLTGFSCNGFTTAFMGTNFDVQFRGIIPFNAALLEEDFVQGSFKYSNTVSTCICIGTADPGIVLNNRLYDSLTAYQSKALFNELPGIGHTYNFPGFKSEMMECFRFFGNDIVADVNDEQYSEKIRIVPNPVLNELSVVLDEDLNNCMVLISDLMGNEVYKVESISDQKLLIRNLNMASGMYSVKVIKDGQVLYIDNFVKL